MQQVPNTQKRIRVVLVQNAKPTTTSLNSNTLKARNTQISNFQTMKTAKRYEILFKIWPSSNYLLTYVAETKVILREIYSILIGNDSLLKHPQVIEVIGPSTSILQGIYKITLRVQDLDSDQRTPYYLL